MSIGRHTLDFERRFSGRTHVGTVTHLEGWDVPHTAVLALDTLRGMGLAVESVSEGEPGSMVFHAAAHVTAGAPMELWLVASERPFAGTQLELRIFHELDDAALADECLAAIAGHFAHPGA